MNKPNQDLYTYELKKNHRRNALLNIIDGSLFQIGFVCFIPGIIIVAFLKHYTNNQLILNLPVLIPFFAMNAGPFVASFFSGRFKSKKKITLATVLLQRLFFIPMFLVLYFLNDSQKWIVPAFLVTFTLFYLAWGAGVIFWQEFIGRCFQPHKISSVMGVREGISRIFGAIASVGVMVILGQVAFPNNFILLFIISFISWNLCFVFVYQMKEAPYDIAVEEKPSAHLKNTLLLPVKDKTFRWYTIFIMLLYGYLFLGSLYTVVAIERFKDIIGQDQLTGVINIVTTVSAAAFALGIGKFSERMNKTTGFLMVAVVAAILPVLAIFCHNFYLYMGILFLSGMINILWLLEFSAVLNFTVPERRHEYLAFMSIMKLFPIIIYTNLGGFLTNTFSPSITFVISSALCIAALFVLLFKLKGMWEAETASDVSRESRGLNA